MVDISTFIDAVHDDFGKLGHILEEDQQLPPKEILEEVCKVLLNVSCLREEGRYPSFRVCFIPPSSDLLKTYLYARVFCFEEPIDFGIRELHKLAPALNADMSYLMVDLGSRPFKMVGILASHTTWQENMMKVRHRSGTRMPRIPNITVRDTGRLEICFGEMPVLCYNAGQCIHYRTDTFTSTLVADQLRSGSGISEEDRLSVLYRIMARINSYGHGGLLFIVPSAEACRGLIDIKYRLPGSILPENENILTFLSDKMHEKNLAAYADMIAKFSCVDGGVVLTKDLDILGFGGEAVLNLANVDPPRICFMSYDNRIDLTKKFADHGMRHRACYRICDAIEGAVAIVFSQDGSIKACTGHEGRIFVYENVALPVR